MERQDNIITTIPACLKDPMRPMSEGSPGVSFRVQKSRSARPSRREAKRGAIPYHIGFPFGESSAAHRVQDGKQARRKVAY